MDPLPPTSTTREDRATVALVRSDNRRGAVAQALALLNDELRDRVGPSVLIKPNLVSHRRQLPSTHPDALSAVVDAVLGAGAREVLVAEGASDATLGFERFGYHRELFGLPVRFFDLNRDETEWDEVNLVSVDGAPLRARVARTITNAPFRVSLALAKTHVTAMLTLSIKNMLSSLHPDDRVMMHGYPPGRDRSGHVGWKAVVVNILKQDNGLVNVLTRTLGRIRNARNLLRGQVPCERLTLAERGFLRSVAAMQKNLVALLRATQPTLSVIDGFVGMHREGPRHGTPIRLGVAVVGIDPVAVDSVVAAVMGFDPRSVGYLALAEAAGLGVADLDRIRIVGDPLSAVRRRCIPHSNHVVQRHWRALIEPRPIFSAPHWGGRMPSLSRSFDASEPAGLAS